MKIFDKTITSVYLLLNEPSFENFHQEIYFSTESFEKTDYIFMS